MMMHPTLRYMVSEVDQQERQAVAAAARRAPRPQLSLLARLSASLREWRQPAGAPVRAAQPSVASRRLVEVGS